MEDAHICSLASEEDYEHKISIFAVFDGHAGDAVSHICAEELKPHVERAVRDFPWPESAKALVDAFEAFDAELLLRKIKQSEEFTSIAATAPETAQVMSNAFFPGSTATVVVVADDEIITANAGDSRAVLCRGGRAVPLSIDHKPSRASEKQRIELIGGIVRPTIIKPFESSRGFQIGPDRVWPGGLSVSRGFGDKFFKDTQRNRARFGIEHPLVTVVPEVTRVRVCSPQDEFVIVACDGLWDTMTSQEAVDIVRSRRPIIEANSATDLGEDESEGESVPTELARELVAEALDRGSTDNVSVVIALFRHATTPSRASDWAKIATEVQRVRVRASMFYTDQYMQLAHAAETKVRPFSFSFSAAVAAPTLCVDLDRLGDTVLRAMAANTALALASELTPPILPDFKSSVESFENPDDPARRENLPRERPEIRIDPEDISLWGIVFVPIAELSSPSPSEGVA